MLQLDHRTVFEVDSKKSLRSASERALILHDVYSFASTVEYAAFTVKYGKRHKIKVGLERRDRVTNALKELVAKGWRIRDISSTHTDGELIYTILCEKP